MSSRQCFYHYTSTAGASGIRNDGVIKTYNRVMLSKLNPENHSRNDILRSIYGNSIPSKFNNRADNIVVVDESILDASKLRQINSNLYKYSGDIKINASDVRDKPTCTNRNSLAPLCVQRSTNANSSGSYDHGGHNQTIYYYTSKTNAIQIQSSGYIGSNGSILLTTLTPEDNFRDEILKAIYGSNYDRNQYATSADWCVKISITKLSTNKLKKRHNAVYEYSGYIKVNSSEVIDKPRCNKNSGRSSSAAQHQYLYHYTNSKGAQAIKTSGYVKKSGASGAFGVGVYMTNLIPNDFFRDDILKNNYGGINSAFKGRADWVVRIKQSDLDGSKLKKVSSNVTNDGNRNIFVYENEIKVKSSDVYDKPPCHRAK